MPFKGEEYGLGNAIDDAGQNAGISLITERGTGAHAGAHFSQKLSEDIDSVGAMKKYREKQE